MIKKYRIGIMTYLFEVGSESYGKSCSALCAAIHLGICQTGISLCCTGRIKTYKKYKWKFSNGLV